MLLDAILHGETVQILVGQLPPICGLPRSDVDLGDRACVPGNGLADRRRYAAQGTSGGDGTWSSFRGWSSPYRYPSTSASHEASMMFSETPTVVHSR